jgi:5,10-methylenetetrahydromethanopterin reductase
LQFGIAFQSDKRPAEYAALAQAVDRFGFDVVSVYNDLLYQPALGALLWMAPHLRTARLGPAALNPYTLHPLEIAGQAALLDLATDGRAYLGLARGAWLDALGVPADRPIQRLREAAGFIRHVLGRRSEAFEGDIFRLASNATLRYAPLRGSVPLMIGTWGQRTARLAGEIADEIKIGGSTNPALIAHLAPAVRAGEASSGRAQGSVGLCFGAVTVIDRDARAARAFARRQVAMYLPVVAPLDPTIADQDWLARLTATADPADVARQMPDALLDRFAFAGDPPAIIRQVQALQAAGATRVEFGTPHGLGNPVEAIELLGAHVLPAFR